MAHRTDVARSHEILARWCALAEARLEHLTELFESGRWRRYHSERAFLENVQEAKRAVETWRGLLQREASLDNSPIDISWLGRGRVTPLPPAPRLQPPAFERPVLRTLELAPPVAPIEIAVVDEDVPVVAEEEPAPEKTPIPVLDFAAMQARYPLLRSSF